MLDIKLIRENTEDVIARLAAKGKEARAEVERIVELDAQRRAMISENEAKKAELDSKQPKKSEFVIG